MDKLMEENKKEVINEENQKEKINTDNKEKENIEPNKSDSNSQEFSLKDHYSIDDISYSKFEEIENEDLSSGNKNISEIYALSQSICEDNLENCQKILSENKILIHFRTIEGFNFIQYAAFYGAINCFKHLLTYNINKNEDIEGFHLIHLSLMRCIFNRYKNKCMEMFKYIFENMPEQRNLVDRLGRTCFHIIFEYDFAEAIFDNNIIELEDLFKQDNNGEFAINYIYIFNASDCFYKVAKDEKFLMNLYLEARNRFQLKNKSNGGETKFLENLFLYQNIHIIAFLVLNCKNFYQIFLSDLETIYQNYLNLQTNDLEDNKNNSIRKMLENIKYIVNCIQKFINSLIEENFQFKFPHCETIKRTAIIYNKNCINHIKLPDEDPIKHIQKRKKIFENSDRLSCLIGENDGIIRNDKFFNKYIIVQTERKSCLNDILKCHDIKFIKALKYKSDNIMRKKKKVKKKEEKKQDENIQFWDNIDISLIEKNYFLLNKRNNSDELVDLYNYERIDYDTFINQYSYENIFNTTGCVFQAIDMVMEEKVTNAFALIRPPGHHSGYFGPVENGYNTSMGYCVVNNIAIGAAYTKYKYSDIIKKIAIVDIDIHHGNGTEEIIEMLNYKSFSKPFRYEKVCGVKITEKQNINWLDFDDAKNVLFISTHIFDKNQPEKFYPYSGSEEKNTPKDSDIYPGGIYNIPFEFKENYPYEYRNILRSRIIPRLYKFKPDIIFISAGFDGHKLEIINENKMSLQENDFGYIALQLQSVANKFCKGRMISVLEGGYNVSTGLISSFAQSVFYFTRFMNLGINKLQCTEVKMTGQKREAQLNEEMELFNSIVKERNKPRRSERLKNMENKKNESNKKDKNEIKMDENEKQDLSNKKEINDINEKSEKNNEIDETKKQKEIESKDNK